MKTDNSFDTEKALTSGEKRLHKRSILLVGLVILSAAVLLILFAIYLYLHYWAHPAKNKPGDVTAVIRGTEATLLRDPLAVALWNNKFYVTDAKNGRVVVFKDDGSPLFDFKGGGVHSPLGSKLIYPYGIAINSRGEVYVADVTAGKVIIFSESGQALRLLTLLPGRRFVAKPLVLTFDSENNLYVAEAKTGKVYVYDARDKLRAIVGDGKLSYPNGIAVKNNGDIYVSDSNRQRILVYNQFGVLRRKIDRGRGDKTFLPRGLAFDRDGHLLVADTLNSQIIEFNDNGREISKWGNPGTALDQLNFPNGIAFSPDGKLYVVDRGNNRVVIWKHRP